MNTTKRTHRPARIVAALVALAVLGTTAAAASGAVSLVSRKVASSHDKAIQNDSSVAANFSATVRLPSNWKTSKASSTSIKFTEGQAKCRYAGTISAHVERGATGNPLSFVRADLPETNSRLILDEGVRNTSAWRVIRVQRQDNRTQVKGEFARPLTVTKNALPSGQAAWLVIKASATSRPGGECHSGTYRAVLGPYLGDAFATSRTSGFVFPKGS
jgi:hypothetical protein